MRRAGGSYVVAIPKEICEAVKLSPNDEVKVFVEEGKIVIKK